VLHPLHSSIHWTMQEPDSQMIIKMPKKVEQSNTLVLLMYINKQSRLTVFKDFTEDLLFHALVLLSTEDYISVSLIQ